MRRARATTGRRDPRISTATERMLRTLGVLYGFGALAHVALLVPMVVAHARAYEGPGELWPSFVVVSGLAVAMGVASALGRLQLAKGFGLASGFAFALLHVFALMLPITLPTGESTWTFNYVGVAAAAVAICGTPTVAWVYAVGIAVLSGALTAHVHPQDSPLLGVLDGAYGGVMNVIFVSLILASRTAASRLQAESDRARHVAAAQAAGDARRQQRVRIDALTHDHVLSVLLTAARDRGSLRMQLRDLAASTLTLLTRERAGSDLVSPEEVVARLRALVSSTSTRVGFDAEVGPGAVGLPDHVADALVEATSEAVRNSLKHAGPASGVDGAAGLGSVDGVLRTVRVRVYGDTVRVTVIDDGRGFAFSRIPVSRLGVRVSVIGRMKSLAGGTATVDSWPGGGTVVRLAWSRTDSARTVAPAAPPTGMREAQPAVDMAALLAITTVGGRVVLVVWALLQTSLLLSSLDEVRWPWLSVAALVLTVAAGVLVCAPAPHPLPQARTWMIGILCSVASVSVFGLAATGWPSWSSWVWGAVTYVLFFVALRGRIRVAWLLFGVMSAITIAWVLWVGRAPTDAVGFLIRHAAFLLVATGIAVLISNAIATARDLEHVARQLAERSAAGAAALDEQNARIASLLASVGPSLTLLASERDLTDDDRARFLLLEAAVRDTLRGEGLLSPAVADAAWRARSRGVEVSLLDDRDATVDRVSRLAVEGVVVAHLDSAAGGTVAVRLLPEGRHELVTIIANDGAGVVRASVPNDGELVSE